MVLNLGVVQVGVEHDGAEGHREGGVRVHERVAPGVLPLLVLLPRERFHQAVDALSLSRQKNIGFVVLMFVLGLH